MQPRKVVVKVVEPSAQQRQAAYLSRSPSPLKTVASPASSEVGFRPKAKVNSSATSNLVARKATVASSSPIVRTGSVKSTISVSTSRTASPTRNGSRTPIQPQPPRPRAAVTRGIRPTGNTTPRNPFDASRSDIVDLSGPEDAPSPRIKAKLSNLSKNIAEEGSRSPQLLPQQQFHRPRVPSVSSTTTSSSLSPRPNSYYQPFPDAAKFTRANGNGFPLSATVDPTTVPLPSHSPPTSALSFSSRSSVSVSSGVHSDDRNATNIIRGGLENLLGFSEILPGEETETDEDLSEEEDEIESTEQRKVNAIEREVRAEAKSVRKIADLEITNRSLLTINTSLEQTKHRQAKEIRELRRKLRESRLVLPPKEFRAVSMKDTKDHESEDDETDEEDEGEEREREREKHDQTYKRIKIILEGLIETGRRALETTSKDFPEEENTNKPKVAKVLSAFDQEEDEDEDRPLSPSRVAVPDSDSESDHDEAEVMKSLLSPSPSPQRPT
ncbi:hypothetical protein MIND_00511000 [Mycena indigotica]|uniref:Uncharacterized protein n=1 Tax=Mycena indigotica TaxID=2126181 RepID=A0A8H6SXI0_9AGAR|nr:uncharacterized protein MIND_00511000 [Mycena indigotica]KAF7307174.1 hypothetical protein MIND_00511000 [Mycena indigotica]